MDKEYVQTDPAQFTSQHVFVYMCVYEITYLAGQYMSVCHVLIAYVSGTLHRFPGTTGQHTLLWLPSFMIHPYVVTMVTTTPFEV